MIAEVLLNTALMSGGTVLREESNSLNVKARRITILYDKRENVLH